MASIRKQALIDSTPEQVWDALRAWDQLHTRLAPGFVTDVQLDGADRIVTFFDGAQVREVLITLDERERRLVWSIVDGPYTHHNGAAQVLEADDSSTLFEWRADLLPDGAAARTEQMMELGIEAIGAAFGRS
jgi:hypothetical protein